MAELVTRLDDRLVDAVGGLIVDGAVANREVCSALRATADR